MANQQHKPIAPPVTWFGSKSRLVKKIVGYFPEHQTFVDVFGGSGAVLLGKRPAKVEVYNDLNKKMVSLFRVLSCPKKTSELKRLLEYTPYSRDEFNACHGNRPYSAMIDLRHYSILILPTYLTLGLMENTSMK